MCGIIGFAWDDKNLVKRMAKQIRHRGPDAAGTYNDKNISLGHQRLSIIDLSERAKQPMTGEDKTIWIVFNGEIYNWKELRKKLENGGHSFVSDSDTEAIVHAYEEYGDQCTGMLEGDFAFAIYDSNKKKILLARDRVGIKPLYYTFVKGKLAFSSEIKALLEIPGLKRRVNNKIFDRYLTLRYPFGRETMFDGIYRMLPGELLMYDCKSKRAQRKKYWQMQWQPGKQSELSLITDLREALKGAVQRQLMSDVPLGAYLSGGVDSAATVAMMSRVVDEPIKTFSVGFGREDADELKFARAASQHLGTDHEEFIIDKDAVKLLQDVIWHSDEPIADPAMIPVYILSQKAKKHATVVLTGDGGDELFGGYEQHKFLRFAQRARKFGIRPLVRAGISASPWWVLQRAFKYSKLMGPEGIKRAKQLLRTDIPVEQYLAITSIFSANERAMLSTRSLTAEKYLQAHFNGNIIDDALKFEFEVQLPENMLMKTDRMTMAHAIEARVPLLDTKVLEVASRIPLSMKLRGSTEKYIFRRAVAPWIPKRIMKRKKQRFYVPIDDWLKQSAPLLDRAFSQELMQHGLLDKDYITRIQEKYKTAPLFYARQLWTLLTFQLWYERHIL